MTSSNNNRKLDHIRIITEDEGIDRKRYYFDEIRLAHRAFPELDLEEVDPSTTFMGKRLSFPLLISCMTGGQDEKLEAINRNLATAAEACGVAMGVGSQRVMFSDPASRKSFQVRRHAPNTLLFANLGAVQLNYGFDISHCRDAVETAGADALCLHLNPLQEAVQPEGDTNFSGLMEKVASIASELDGKVVLKEVGAGISGADVELAVRGGIRYIDVAGTGGTSWSRVEHYRRHGDGEDGLGMAFQDWGIPTPVALRMLEPFRDRLTLIASGGIRSGIDMVKAIILGASLCGLASPFLKPAMESPEAVVRLIERLRGEFVTAMFLLGIRSIDRLFSNASLLLPLNRTNT